MDELNACFEELQKLFEKKTIIQREIFDNIAKVSDADEVSDRKEAVNIFNKCVMSQMGIDMDPDPLKYYKDVLGPYTEGFPEEEDFRSALRPIRERISQLYYDTESIDRLEEDKALVLDRAKKFGLSVDAMRRINIVYYNEIREIRLQKLVVLCQKMDELHRDLKDVKEFNDIVMIKTINEAISEKATEIKHLVKNEVFGKNAIKNSLKIFNISSETTEKVIDVIEKKEREIDKER